VESARLPKNLSGQGKPRAISFPHISMNARLIFSTFAGFALWGCGSIVHTPARTSVEVALAKRAEVIRLAESAHPEPRLTSYRGSTVNVPAVEPELPALSTNDRIEAVAESYTHGMEALNAGKTDEAVKALEEATKLDPGFAEAWEHLAEAYEKVGQNAKAMDAYAKSKNVAKH
jgi:tetratricopeptide (TPR) repeat protein